MTGRLSCQPRNMFGLFCLSRISQQSVKRPAAHRETLTPPCHGYAMQSMRSMKFYVLFFGTNALLWVLVTLFGRVHHPGAF